MSINYVTEEVLQKLKDELNKLKKVDRPAASNAIAEAREKGDLKENAEYDAAKEAQGLLEAKINKLEQAISNSRILDPSTMDTSRVSILSTVKIKNLKNNKSLSYQIVSETESDIKQKKLSVNSPIGKGLLGKKIGEIAEVETPNGIIKFEVEDISY